MIKHTFIVPKNIYYYSSIVALHWPTDIIQGRTVVSPYVGMARKQDGGSNGWIRDER